jgi:VCBS repeat protein
LALTHLGWSDYSSGGGDRRTVWSVDSLSYTAQPNVSPIVLPVTPNPEIPSITVDYYPVLETVDFDGDGRRELVAGGFITGRLYYYRNTGNNPDGTPKLVSQGPILADGVPLDSDWGAAPTVADFNGDGLKDIIVGTLPLTPGGGDAASSDRFLEYYMNNSSPTNPSHHKTTLPITGGKFPVAGMGTPRAADFNNDGLLDLKVSTNWQIYMFKNVGTSTSPMFAAHSAPLRSEWGAADLGATQLIDWNGDGRLDLLNGY